VDSHYDGVSAESSYAYNDVTFVYDGRVSRPESVEVVGSFGDLFAPVPLRSVRFIGQDTGLHTVTLRVPKAQVHTYKFAVDGRYQLDPVNPQRSVADNGQPWSRFFTDACQVPLVLSRREREVLARLVTHLLPFRLAENRQSIQEEYDKLDRAGRGEEFPLAYRLDEEVGTVNYIDKVLACPPSSTTPTIITPACRSSMACCGLAPAARTHCSCRSRTTPSSTARWPPIRSRRASLFMFGGTTEQQEPLDDGAGQSAAAGRDVGPDGDELRGLLVRCAYGGSVTLSLLDGAPGGAIIER
jgi:hypothetical protein